MGMTMVEKILAKGSKNEKVVPGEIVTVEVDTSVLLDLSFSDKGRRSIPEKVFDPDKIAVVLDHAIPAPNVHTADGLQNARKFVEKFGIEKYYGEGRHGISHQLMAELGFTLPGTILACSDSHTCASGAFNCAARGVGSQEMLYVICKGETWFKVCPTIKYVLDGELPEGVYPRDIIHYIAGEYGDHVGHNVEFVGSAVEKMDMAGRQTIATISAELSAEFAMFEADDKTAEYLKERTDENFEPVFADSDADYADIRTIDVSKLEPMIVMPHFVPNNVKPISDVNEEITIDQGFIGSCANARIEDFRSAAEILKGQKVHPNVRLIITPSSSEVMKQASREGLLEIFMEAGAVTTNSTCGACYGGHMGVIGKGERCLTSSTRNFKGRMGSPDSEVYMGSPATVAASAIAGSIHDPRKSLSLQV
ncbi:3-isopropylmalate dehydratase large subunit [Salicibibacter cibarius]|uniref:aconitate hydratase n=1 Tax=Salicibibacter cibarius TaxID=2743000 RepID=A0A7T6Z6K4_9BACI|nr:aconitase/3-isopropylmalate dehydratase large subunit family protein [Salicibibacter cibarius]QQK77815.1 3-isopropylmalate dehydratase large subunit [Salicibibacter cibarius]